MIGPLPAAREERDTPLVLEAAAALLADSCGSWDRIQQIACVTSTACAMQW